MAERRVDGIFLIDLAHRDAVLVLEELGLLAVVIGGARPPRPPAGGVERRRQRHGHGGRVPGRARPPPGGLVAGPARMLHTELRTQAFGEVAERLALESAVTVATDYSPEQGAQVRRLLSGPRGRRRSSTTTTSWPWPGPRWPTRWARMPRDLSIVAWDDSVLCEIVHPPLTVLSRDIMAYGTRAAERLLALLDGDGVGDFEDAMPRLIVAAAPPAHPPERR